MSIARYTRFVALSKRFLWLLIAAMIALLVWIASGNGNDKARIVFSHILKTEALQNVMAKPHYQGIDAHDRPYTVIAEQATQLDKDNVALVTIRADMEMGEGKWVALTAGSGQFNMQTKLLELKDGVDLFYDGGYEFRSDHAHVDIGKGSAYGDSPVEGQGPPGTLKSDSFSLENHGDVIDFNGSVRMKLYRQ